MNDWQIGEWDFTRGEVTVCVTHRRFVPCRREGSHFYSSVTEDIEMVRDYQQGKALWIEGVAYREGD